MNPSGRHAIILAVSFLAAGTDIGDATTAEPLKSAKVSALRNEVVIHKEGQAERPAARDDVVQGRDVLHTGRKSRAELEFTDKSIARLGSNTIFSFNPVSRDMSLQRGTALIHVPPGLSGARIISPAATAAIRGDVVAMRVNERGLTQIVALSKDAQGPITVMLNTTGEERVLQAGQMMTVDPAAMKLPEPMTISVEIFTQSSALINGDQGFRQELPATAKHEMRLTEAVQRREIQSGAMETSRGLSLERGLQANARQVIGMDNIAVQASAGSRFGGTYIGRFVDLPPNTNRGLVALNFQPDGTMTGFGVNTTLQRRFSISGTFTTDGRFSFENSNGGGGTGQLQFQENTIDGLVSHASSSGNAVARLQATKQ